MKNNIFKLINDFIFRICEKLLQRFPEDLFGRVSKLKEIYEKRYWNKDVGDIVKAVRLKTASKYLCVSVILLLLITTALITHINRDVEITKIERPDFGTGMQTQRLTAQLQYKEETLTQKTSFRIAPRELTQKQIAEKLDVFADTLPERILGKNKDLEHVITNLELIDEEPLTGIKIEWLSDSPEFLSNKGQIDSVGIKEAETSKTGKEDITGTIVKLTAVYKLKDQERQTSFLIRLLPDASSDDKQTLKNRLQNTIDNLEKNMPADKTLVLPKRLSGNISIKWKQDRSMALPEVIFAAFAAFILIYLFRYRKANAERKADREGILKDLPEFVNKLVLLLSAGLVTEAAVRKIIEDYQKHTDCRRKPLYEGFCEIEKRMTETNAPFLKELRLFAQKSDVREFIRFSAILEENIHTGSSLSEKLEGEAAMLWFYRKKNAEEKGRLAETKLTFPLVIQLLVLMLITLAPVFINSEL